MSSRIAIRVLGQNLTTEVSGGSYAAATVHAAVKASILSDDALMLSQCLRNDVLKPWAKFNLSAGSGVAPIVSLDTDPPEQKNEKAQALKATAEALVASAGALDAMMKLGLKVDLARFAKEQELPLSSNEITPPPVPQLPEPTPQPPTPTHVLSLAQPLGIEGEIEQALTIQQELDGVAEDASKLGAQSFDGLLSALNSVVQDIDDEAELQVETLKAKLLDVYGQFDESEFERIMEASLILSDGLGDSSVLAQPTIEEKEGEP
jgi:phage gp29-like protein